MTSTNKEFNLVAMVQAVKSAVSGAILTENKWETAGSEVAKVYATAQALDKWKRSLSPIALSLPYLIPIQ